MTGGKWWIGIIFQAQLDSLSGRLSCDLGYNMEAKVDPGCDAARGDEISVLDDAALLMRRANEGQQLAKAQWVVARRPLRRPATPRMKAPVHTEVTYFAVPDCRRTNSIVSRSAIARTTPALPPGTQMRSREL